MQQHKRLIFKNTVAACWQCVFEIAETAEMLNGSVNPPPPHYHQPSRKAHGCVCMHLDAPTTHTNKSCALTCTKKKQPKRAAPFSWYATCQAIPPALHRHTLTPDWLKAQPESCKPLSHRNPSLHSLTITEKKIGEKKRKERRTQVRAKGITLHADSPYLVYLRLYPRLPPSGGSLLLLRRIA